MNQRHLGLTSDPFSLTPDPSTFYPSTQHATAESVLEYALESQAGFALLTGEIGCGKSLLVSRLLSKLGDSVLIGLINHPHGRLQSIHKLVATALRIEHKGIAEGELYETLTTFMQQEFEKGRRSLLIVDEAQNLSPEVLEELRLLSNANGRTGFLDILLVGETELRTRLGSPELAHFAQRIAAQFHLPPLACDETHAYIRHRLQAAGGNPSLFTPEAMDLVHARTAGVPRLINQLCHFVLVQAHAAERMRVDADLMRQVPDNFWGSFSTRAAPALPAGRVRQRVAKPQVIRTHAVRRPTQRSRGARWAAAAVVAVVLSGAAWWQLSRVLARSTSASSARASQRSPHGDRAVPAKTPAPVVAAVAAAPVAAAPAPPLDVPVAPLPQVKPLVAAAGAAVTRAPSTQSRWFLVRASERLNDGDSAGAERLLQQAGAAGARPEDMAELRAGIDAQKLELRLMAVADQVKAAIASNALLDPANANAATRYLEMSALSPRDPLTLRAQRDLHAALLTHAQDAVHKDQMDLAKRYFAAVAKIGGSQSAPVAEPAADAAGDAAAASATQTVTAADASTSAGVARRE